MTVLYFTEIGCSEFHCRALLLVLVEVGNNSAIQALEFVVIAAFLNVHNFSFFLEKQMLSYFLSIMAQKCGSYVCVQLLQTLNILFENIRHETSLCEFIGLLWLCCSFLRCSFK